VKISYCAKCKPAAIVSIGASPTEVVIKGKKVPVKPPSHIVNGQVHEAKLLEVKDLPRNPGEDIAAYMKRIVDANKAALV
jgi:hypothetical protein